tara:strand:+ start:1156 stop:2439 length:1284 start_codon:yes stop_codon:yes gene_type:complete
MTIFWLLTSYSSQNILRQQADILGKNLASQTAAQVTELMLANDLISMNVVLSSLANDSTISEVSVVDINNRIIARASAKNSEIVRLIPLPIPLLSLENDYVTPISIADSIIGYVRLTLDMGYIDAGMVDNLALIMIATVLLLIVSIAITTLYYKYLINFPINLLSFYIGKIRKGEVEACPVPKDNNELTAVIRQFNATAEFLTQNTFLKNIGVSQPITEERNYKDLIGKEDTTVLLINMSNFQYLASTLSERNLASLLNKYYFYSGKISQLYNGYVCFCSEDEILINFNKIEIPEEQAFYAICGAQLFLQLFADMSQEVNDAKFRLAIHSGNALNLLYSPITQKMDNLSGQTLDITRMISKECPDNSILISEPAFTNAGAGTRVDAEEFGPVGGGEQVNSLLALSPMSEYKFLLQKQAVQLLKLYKN